MTKNSLILLAGGKGTRMESKIPKVFLSLKKRAIILHSFALFFSMKEIDETVVVCPQPYRSLLYEVYTPQLLRRDLLKKGLATAKEKKLTDDVALAELIDHPVKIVTGSSYNIKITHPIDLKIAEIS